LNDPNAGVVLILRKTQPWVRLVSICGFISVALIAVFGAVSWIGMSAERVEHAPLVALLIYPVMLVMYLIPSLQLLKYSRRIGTFVAQGHTVQLEAALDAQRAFWRFIGIVVAASAVMMAVMFVASMFVGILIGV
jgi:hypothetical protein